MKYSELEKRNTKIRKQYEKIKNYTAVGKEHGLTGERIKQIVNPSLKFYCKKHLSRRYQQVCEMCNVEENYLPYLQSFSGVSLEHEIENLPGDRKPVTVLKRKILALFLRDVKKHRAYTIAKLLNRTPASISYLLNGKTNKRRKDRKST